MTGTISPKGLARELLPCPFCGSAPEVDTYETESLWSHDTVTYTRVGCSFCEIHFSTEPGHEIDARQRWNTRALSHSEPNGTGKASVTRPHQAVSGSCACPVCGKMAVWNEECPGPTYTKPGEPIMTGAPSPLQVVTTSDALQSQPSRRDDVERLRATFDRLSRAIHGQGDGAPKQPAALPWFYSIYLDHADAIAALGHQEGVSG